MAFYVARVMGLTQSTPKPICYSHRLQQANPPHSYIAILQKVERYNGRFEPRAFEPGTGRTNFQNAEPFLFTRLNVEKLKVKNFPYDDKTNGSNTKVTEVRRSSDGALHQFRFSRQQPLPAPMSRQEQRIWEPRGTIVNELGPENEEASVGQEIAYFIQNGQ